MKTSILAFILIFGFSQVLSLKKDSDQDVFLTEEQVEYILCSLKVISLQMKEFAKINACIRALRSYRMRNVLLSSL